MAAITSAIIALCSLGVIVYKEFIQGARLKAVIDQITLMRVPTGNRVQLLMEILLDDLLSPSPTNQARTIAGAAMLDPIVKNRNRDRLRVELVDYTKKTPVDYAAEPRLLEPYLTDQRFGVSFYCPLIIYNAGRRAGHVSSLVLVARSVAAAKKVWAFAALTQVDPIQLVKRKEGQVDADVIAGTFIGVSIAPSSSQAVHAWFVPINDANNRIISRTSIEPGKCQVQVFGYGAEGRRVLTTPAVEYDLQKAHMLQAFGGSEGTFLLTIDKAVADAVEQAFRH